MKKFTLFATCAFMAGLCCAPHQARGQSVPPGSQDSLIAEHYEPQWLMHFTSFEDTDWDETTPWACRY